MVGHSREWAARAHLQASESAAQCESEKDRGRQPPSVAFCITGAARSFPTRLVLSMLQSNLFTALGAAPRSRFFLQLKVNDSDKLAIGTASTSFHRHRETSAANLQAALAQPWLRAKTAEAVVINGSGASFGEGNGMQPSRVVPSNDSMWSKFRATKCKSSYLKVGNNEERLILQHLGIAWCGHAIPRYEAKVGRQFDLLVYTRPDLVWWKPIVPWCVWRWEHQMLACNAPGCDMAWVAPRASMPRLMNQLEYHRDCFERGCCSTSEHLLWYVQSSASGGESIYVNHSMSHFLVQKDSESGPTAIRRAGRQSVSLLRSVNKVCRQAFDYAFNESANVNRHVKDAFKFIPSRGLPLATIANLRRVLMQNHSLCPDALRYVSDTAP